MKHICLILFLLLSQSAKAQDDVELIPPIKYKRTQFGGQASFISNSSSVYNAGGGFWLSYSESLKATNMIELGGQFEYNVMGSSSIYFDDGVDFFSNHGAVMRINFVSSIHPLRFNSFDLFQELYTGTLLASTTSTYYVDEQDEDGSLQKLRVKPAWNIGAGLGFRYKVATLKFVYHYSSPLNQVDVDEIYYSEKLVYPEKRAPIGAFNIYLGIVFN